MATNKNQHYVPKCHLKRFSTNPEKTAINVFNIDIKNSIRNASIRKQCSGDWFYGKDEKYENVIQSLESDYTKNIDSLIEKISLNQSINNELFDLSKFWVMQYIRTNAAGKRFSQGFNEIGADAIRLEIKEAVRVALSQFYHFVAEVSDLDFCIVSNNTNVPFITSDDPAIITNRWKFFYDQRSGDTGFGLGSAGLICVIPLTPKYAMIGYDNEIYNINTKNSVISTKEISDIDAINHLQFLNCSNNIYFNDEIDDKHLTESYSSAAPHRIEKRHILHRFDKNEITSNGVIYRKSETSEESTNGQLVMISDQHPKPVEWPRFLRWRVTRYYYFNNSGVNKVRKSFAVSNPDSGFKRIRAR
ncbi:DUF4238 domain-containing protein [Comamonas thiooxydans]|uniref:DUF4238 domain-containing protein n=1 Tax=Comamonas thiooxydans TaxID=363952 RepID=UPI00311DE131